MEISIVRNWRAVLTALTFAAMLFLQACAAGQVQEPPVDVSGNWSGNNYPGCRPGSAEHCYDRLITMQLVQQGSKLSGSYTCAAGSLGCLGGDNTGQIVSGRIDGSQLSDLRIGFSDATSCLYQGQFGTSGGTGEYICFVNGMRIIEEGGWQLKRTGR